MGSVLAKFCILRNNQEIWSCKSKTRGGTHNFPRSNAFFTGKYHWPLSCSSITFSLYSQSSSTAIHSWNVTATELICLILWAAQNRNSMVDWTAVCWNNKNILPLYNLNDNIIQYWDIQHCSTECGYESLVEQVRFTKRKLYMLIVQHS